MKIINNSVNNIENKQIEAKKVDIRSSQNFNEILKNEIQFSKHANMRLNNRDIKLSDEQIKRVEKGVNKACEKGIRDSLVFVDNIALVINVRSKTVVTAMSKDSENVFTNIDGAVIV